MSNVKISELPIANDITPDDLLVVVDDPSGSAATKNLLMSTLTTSINDTLPVKDIVGSEYVNVVSTSGNYTISATGLQPSGDYSVVGHTHISTEILEAQPVYNTNQDTYFDTIAEAVAAADPNDIIEISPGIYEEYLSLDKPITLRGPNYNKSGDDPTRGPEAILLYPASLGAGLMIMYGTSDNITIEGLDIRFPDELITQGINYGLLWFSYAQNNLVFRNNRWYSSEIAIYIFRNNPFSNKQGVVVEGNYFDGGPFVNTNGARSIYCGDAACTIQDNVIVNSSIGIQVLQYSNPNPSFIRRNRISSSLSALYNNQHYRSATGAVVTYEQNTISISPNDRSGLKDLVGFKFTGPVAFQGIWSRETTGQNGAVFPTMIVQNNDMDLALDPAKIYNSTVLRAIYFQNVLAGVVATINNNSLVGWTVAAKNDNTVNADLSNNWWGTKTSSKLVLENTSSGSLTVSPVLPGHTTGNGLVLLKGFNLPLSSDVNYDNTTSGLSATNVKAAIDELNNLLGNAATIVDAPATSSSSGVPGQIAYDNEYFYVCVATNTWLRTPIGTW
jgi:hypothetical protein